MDEQLWSDALGGNEAAFETLLERYEQPIYAYFRRRRLPSADSEDLTQQVFVHLLETGSRFDKSRGPFRAFLFGIVRHTWLQHAEKAGRLLPAPLAAQRPIAVSVETEAQRAQESAALARAVESLPSPAREAIELRLYHNLPVAEIAAAMDMPVNTVKSHLFRARERLRRDLAATLGLDKE